MTFAEFVSQRLDALDWQQKRLAYEWQSKVGKGELSTYETRISKLLKDDEEGYEFVLDGKSAAERLAGLAAALGVAGEQLRLLCEKARHRKTLLFDPRLPEKVLKFFQKRAATADGAFRCEIVNASASTTSPCEALRDLAKGSRNPIVVVADDRDRAFFRGADLVVGHVEPMNPGFKLVEFPELTPPVAPRLFDDDGMPMVPHAETEAKERDAITRFKEARRSEQIDSDWARRIEQADEEGVPVTFRIDALARSPSGDDIKRAILRDVKARLQSGDRRTSEFDKQPVFIWFHLGRLIAVAPSGDALVAHVRNYHAVHGVTSLEPLVEAIRAICEGLNPECTDGEFDLRAELHALQQETGVAVEIDADAIRSVVPPRSLHHDRDRPIRVRRSVDDDGRIHELLDDILGREFQMPAPLASLVFRLEAARQAPLLHFEAPTGAKAAVLANIGAGRLLRLDIARYPNEKPTHIRLANGDQRDRRSDILDGGDVRVELTVTADYALEGTVLPTARQRREQEASYDDE